MDYSKQDIETIFSNCLTIIQLLEACECFRILIDTKNQKNNMHLHLAAHLRYRKILENENQK